MKHSLAKFSVFFSMVFIGSCNSSGQKNKTDEYMTGLVKDKKISGASVAVLKNGEVVLSNNYGYADVSKQQPVTDSTQFGIMSITKNFIACAVMQLFDKQMIDLDASVRKYLDKLPAQYDSVLVYQLLNHTAGVPDYVEMPGYMAQANKAQTPWQVLQPVLDRPLAFKPGSKTAYSNSGYFLLGLIIEKVTGGSLKDYLRKYIFLPAGMTNTFLDDNTMQAKTRAKGYISEANDLKESPLIHPSQYWAAGGIITTKTDMIKWNSALSSGTILPAKEIRQMMQPVKLTDGSDSDFGMGFELMNIPGMRIAGNTGAGAGFNATNLQFLDDGLTVIVLTNTSGSNSSMLAKTIRDMVVGKKDSDPAPVSTMDKLDSAIMQLFSDAAKGSFNETLFKDEAALSKFKTETVPYIQSLGALKNVEQKGERKNPESIARKYQVSFETGNTNWIFIFSLDEKIVVINHQ